MNFLKRILPAFFVLFLVSCSNSFTNKASIVVRMPSNDDARAICENDDIGERHISHFGVEVTQNDKLIQEMPKVLPGKEAVFSDVAEGEYTVTVTAYLIVREEDGTQKADPVYKGSDTKFVAAGSEPTKFIIKLAKIESETDDDNSDDEKDTIDCPFYVNPIEDTQFHTAITFTDVFSIKSISEKELQEGQYYQLVTETYTEVDTETNTENTYVKAKINLVTPKEGQAPDVELLKDNLFVDGANYLFVMLMDEEENPYILFTKYTEMLCEENEDFLYDYIEFYRNEEDESAYFDFFYPYNAIQISQYMSEVYQALWEDKELRKSDSVFGTDRPYYLNELNEDNLKKIGVARINFIGSSNGEEETAYTTYAISGNSVSIPGVGRFDYDPKIYAIYSDKDGKNKVSGSITVSAGINNLYIIGEEEGNPEGGKNYIRSEDPYASIAGSYFDAQGKTLEFKYVQNYYEGAPDRCRADIDISDLLNDYKVKSGDTVVFTVSGIPTTDVPALYWQFAKSNGDGPCEVYKDTYNAYCSLNGCFKANQLFTVPIPMNRISIPDGAEYDTIQFVYEGNTPNLKIEKFVLNFRIYDSSKNVYECTKSVDELGNYYNEFAIALKDYEAFSNETFKGYYYFTAATTNNVYITVDELNLWKEKIADGNWVAGNNNTVQEFSSLYVGSDKSEIPLKDCILQFKSKTLYPTTSVTLVGFDIKTKD